LLYSSINLVVFPENIGPLMRVIDMDGMNIFE
jgi:hypothetical protein